MAELTLQIPDELAERLKPIQHQLPTLLEQLLAHETTDILLEQVSDITVSNSKVYLEILDFLLTRPTPQQVINYKVSTNVQDRLRCLLDKNRDASLTIEETQELDTYEQLEHFMILLKARAASQR